MKSKTTLSLLFSFRGVFCDLRTGDPQVGSLNSTATFECKTLTIFALSKSTSHGGGYVPCSLPANVLWGSFVTHSFLPGGRNECVTNEPQRTSAGRLCTVGINLEKLAQRQNSECCNADFWPVCWLDSSSNFNYIHREDFVKKNSVEPI